MAPFARPTSATPTKTRSTAEMPRHSQNVPRTAGLTRPLKTSLSPFLQAFSPLAPYLRNFDSRPRPTFTILRNFLRRAHFYHFIGKWLTFTEPPPYAVETTRAYSATAATSQRRRCHQSLRRPPWTQGEREVCTGSSVETISCSGGPSAHAPRRRREWV